MSSYRSYTPWKSNLGSSYKSSSTYGIGADLPGSTSRYSSLASPSAYRPSISGGTYRIKRDPPTTTPVGSSNSSYVSRYGSAAKSNAKETPAGSDRTSPIKRYTGVGSTSSSSRLGKYGRSRDPSPVALEHTNRCKSKSRDPSPVLESARSKLGGTSYRSSNSGTSSGSSSNRNGYSSRYASATRLNGHDMVDKSISYLTTSDFHARTASSRAKAKELRTTELEKGEDKVQKNGEGKEAKQDAEAETESESAESFVSVLVVTRATSPTPPGSTTVQRTRRMDIAKTIEKTVQRSTKPKQMVEKEIQSDRLDDSTRYLRFSAGSSSSTYSPHRDRISSLRYSASPQSTTTSSPSKEQKPLSNGNSNSNSNSSASKTSNKSKLSPPKAVRLNCRQSSVENLANKPPAAPAKAESPTKSSSSSLAKWPWPNKDFRKSSLNVGPTDRPRKSRTPTSSGGESEEQQLERSPSAGSECSQGSVSSAKKAGKLSKLKAHKSCTPSSSSDSEKSGAKSPKKIGKKKATVNGNKATKQEEQEQQKEKESEHSNNKNSDALATDSLQKLQKLSQVSNFFAARQQDANSEPIFIESSESGEGETSEQPIIYNSLTLDTQTNEPTTITATTNSPTNTTTNLTNSSSTTRCPKETSTELSSEAREEQEEEEPSWWQDTSLQINTASALDYNNKGEMAPFKLRQIDSGEERDWWLRQNEESAEDDTLAEDTLNTLDEEWSSSKVEPSDSPKHKFMPRSRISPEQDAWWLEDTPDSTQNGQTEEQDLNNNEHHVELTIKLPSKSAQATSSSSSDSAKRWWLNGPAKKLFNVQRVDSGERAWWQQQEQEPPPPPVQAQTLAPPTPPPRIIKHWESGERAWWLQEAEEEALSVAPPPAAAAPVAVASIDELDHQAELSNSFYSVRPPPLGQCASPVPSERPLCSSPYDNIPMPKVQMPAAPQSTPVSPTPPTPPPRYSYVPQSMRVGDKLFISRHQNIDELLGGACRPLSPLFYSSAADSEPTPTTTLCSKNMFLEEITPDQVRIHDSTAQLPVIQRMQRDVEWLENGNASNFYIQQQQQPQQRSQIDDAAIQVYKDGDFGAYLDLESSLAEQTEEIEGLQASRKNSLVVRTQLSVRVHAIIEKLLSAEGSDLRRALFSLKQVFQEDKDLVHAFVALGGLNCLVRVGNCADQNYQNYILRALGQVMLYVDGMNGVMKHQPTMEWLYSLIASNYRSVVKTALKLLLVFVEYAESNCYVLVSALHAVDNAQGTLPWTNIMRLLKDYDNADAELVIYATSLINKTLAGLNDQDSFYDESDLLEQQGMETVIQRYMSKPGTDLDLLDQLQLYEAVLKFEDGESDGQRLPQNSMRKTQRYRPGSNTTERRKSRRHSTDNSPAPLTKVLPTAVLRMTPTQATLDEDDSSGSANSTEFSSGLFQEKKPRDMAGVTPGLRRRRERAERHKSFLKEQEEAAANGIFALQSGQREAYGQIVTAIPATIQSGGSPPQSLLPELANNNAKHTNNNSNNNSGCIIETPNNSLLLSPTKQLLSGINSISIINNSFDKLNNNSNSNSNSNQHEFLTKKNLFRERNATVINGIKKNIQQTDSAYKKYENDENRLNNYYTQLNQSPKHQTPTQDVLSPKKALNATDFDFTPLSPAALKLDSPPEPAPLSPVHKPAAVVPPPPPPPPPPPLGWWIYPVAKAASSLTSTNNQSKQISVESTDLDGKDMLLQLKRDHTVKDLTQKLSNLPTSPTQESGQRAIVGDMSGLISKAKEGLAKSKSKGEISRSSSVDQELKKSEPKKSENELHWEELVRGITRPLNLCDMDFTDLHSDDEKDVLAPRGLGAGIPPPPPPLGGGMVMPPPMMPPSLAPPPMFSYGGYGPSSLTNSVNSSMNGSENGDLANGTNTIRKTKKTVKLFWKEVREDMIPQVVGKTIWDELPNANVDTQKLEHLFESRAKDLMTKKQQELNKSKEIIVLDHKRSNAINIAMTKLPPPRAIKAAILKMDATVVTREGIDKLLNMLPSDEERGKIQEAMMSNPEMPLGSAEQFLLTLASISELGARLKLWAFRLDFDNSEKEIAEPLMDLKQGIEILRQNRTFRCILSTLLSVGIFLNGAPVKGFQIEYLAKVPEVKDTVHKHSLLHHLCHMVMETCSDTSDLYSEIGPITRASKADFTDLAHNLTQLESECKASWDRLKLIAKHDCAPPLKQKLVDFLADCAERIIILQIVHRRVMNRYRKFLLWLGMPQHSVAESRPNEFCRTLSEFALEYRTTRERVQQQLEKKANHRERNKTRGKLIIDMAKFKAQTKEDTQDAELKQLLGTASADQADGTLTWRRRRAEQLRSPIARQSEEQFTDGDDEILESLVKTATKASGTRTTPRERKRTRNADRKSLRRTLKNGLTDEEKQHVAALIQTY